MAEENSKQAAGSTIDERDKWRADWKCFVALILAVLLFSGIMANIAGYKWLSAWDFSTLMGKFGTMVTPEKNTFIGTGGISARGGFLFALSLMPGVMLALGLLEILDHYGAIRAAQKLLTPLLRPILGIPGLTSLAMITDLQSTDAGAALTKELHANKQINMKELIIMTGWQYTGAGMINNYVTIGSAVFSALTVPILMPMILIFILKFVGGIIVRVALNTIYRKDFEHE